MAAAVAVGLTTGWQYAPAAGWIAAATAYLLWTWALIGPMGSDATASLAVHVDRRDRWPIPSSCWPVSAAWPVSATC
jgi:hypothetical protein